MPILQQIQSRLGYLTREAMLEVAQFLKMPKMDVYSAVTFYNLVHLNPESRHSVRVCLRTASHMKGGHRVGGGCCSLRTRPRHRGLHLLLRYGTGNRD